MMTPLLVSAGGNGEALKAGNIGAFPENGRRWQDARRANELQTAILAQRAAGAFEQGRFVEALLALDQRAQLAPERIDLMVLRGYAYLSLYRLADARRVFQAVAGTGNREGLRGLAEVDRRVWQMD